MFGEFVFWVDDDGVLFENGLLVLVMFVGNGIVNVSKVLGLDM